MTGDTIVAVASPPGRSARGIVRISGPGTFDLLSRRVGWPGDRPTRGLHRMRFAMPEGRSIPLLVIVFVGPASYTGEDAAELLLPGNPVLLERIVDTLLAAGREHDIDARRAGPGEFTARAYMNDRISLAEAEGVAATIAARCDAQLAAARDLGAGRLARCAGSLADDLADALALVEAGIDFTDQEDVVPIGPATLLNTLSRIRVAIAAVLDRAVGLETLEAVPWVVLTGAPNAGKSTLFNALLGRRRAVVSDVAGTTRDVIAEPLRLGDHAGEVMLVDLAGREAGVAALDLAMQSRALACAMQSRALEAIGRAELLLECVPVNAPLPAPTADPRVILVRTMADRPEAANVPQSREPGIMVSASSGAGLDDLRGLIARRIGDHAVSLAADAVVVQPRHEAALADASEALGAAVALLEPSRTGRDLPEPELLAAAMRAALDALAAVAGEITPDDVLGRVFAAFCVGK